MKNWKPNALWFDEKTGIKTSPTFDAPLDQELWFDEKTGIKTSYVPERVGIIMLWFDEKTGIKTSAKGIKTPKRKVVV